MKWLFRPSGLQVSLVKLKKRNKEIKIDQRTLSRTGMSSACYLWALTPLQDTFIWNHLASWAWEGLEKIFSSRTQRNFTECISSFGPKKAWAESIFFIADFQFLPNQTQIFFFLREIAILTCWIWEKNQRTRTDEEACDIFGGLVWSELELFSSEGW